MSKNNHIFNTNDAREYGVIEAIILSHMRFWLDKNKSEGSNIHEGRVWTFNSYKAFASHFDYLSEKQVRRAITKLEEQGVLISGNFNKWSGDKTKWYSIDDPAYLLDETICPKGQTHKPKRAEHLPKRADRVAQMGRPIPDSKPDNKQQIVNTDTYSLREIAETFLLYWNKRNETRNRLTDKSIKQVMARLKTFTHEEIIEAIDNRSKSDYLKESGHIGNWDSFWRSDSQVDKWLNHKPQSKSIYDIDGEELPF